jgi:RNA polymerase sigma-70 factor (ECF subfamily)
MTADPPLSDEELVERARRAPEDDLRPFEGLVLRHQSRVLANCRYLTGSSAAAEDLAQEVFIKAFFALPRFEGRSSFRTWLHALKANHCLSFLRQQRERLFVSVDASDLQDRVELQVPATSERSLLIRDHADRISAVLDGMADTLRIPLLLRDLDGLSYQEIAESLGIGLSAVKMRIKRGREEFRRLYQEAAEEPAG